MGDGLTMYHQKLAKMDWLRLLYNAQHSFFILVLMIKIPAYGNTITVICHLNEDMSINKRDSLI